MFAELVRAEWYVPHITLRDMFEWDSSERLALCLLILSVAGLILLLRRKR